MDAVGPGPGPMGGTVGGVSRTPSDFRPPWWARGPHTQTLLARILRPAPHDDHERERFETPDGDFMDVDWGPDERERHEVAVEIRAQDRAGLMGELSKLVANLGVNIHSAHAEGTRGGEARLRLLLECRSADQVASVLERIDHHPEVLEVRRVRQR